MTWDWPDDVILTAQRAARNVGYDSGWTTDVEDLESEAVLYLATHPEYLAYTAGGRYFALKKHLIRYVMAERAKHDKESSWDEWAGLSDRHGGDG